MRQRPTGPRIQQVRIPHPTQFHPLEPIPRGHQCAVFQPNHAARGRLGHIQLTDLHLPPPLPRRRSGSEQVATSGHQRTADPTGLQHPGGLVQCIPFGDASQVQAHSRHLQAGRGPTRRVTPQNHLPPTGGRSRRLHLRHFREHPLAPSPLPDIHQGTHGDVEGPVAEPGNRLRPLEHAGQIRTQGHHRAGAGGLGEPAQFRIGLIIAEDPVQFGDAPEGRRRGLVACGLVGRIEHDPERHAHVGLAVFATDSIDR